MKIIIKKKVTILIDIFLFIHIEKYLTVNNENDKSGNAKLYDKLRSFTSEFITIITQCLFIGLLILQYTNIIAIINPAGNKSNIIKANIAFVYFFFISILFVVPS